MSTTHSRIEAIDVLRGLVMVLMALDHTRDFLTAGSFDPRNFDHPVLFLTRWVTHICAPTFIFLAGLSCYLWRCRHTKKEAAVYILKRGIWLIILEFTLVRMGWTFSLTPSYLFMQVIWVIGISMVLLSGLIYLPLRLVRIFSLVLIFGHNLLDTVPAYVFGNMAWLWNILHAPDFLHPREGVTLLVLYPVIPWVGVMSLGYCLGDVLVQENSLGRKRWFTLGVTCLVGFMILRAINIYGDPKPWVVQKGFLQTTLAFINCEKYPPSLLYLLMTLGMASLLTVLFATKNTIFNSILYTYGRVPLFFYVIHIPIIHFIALIAAYSRGVETDWLFYEPFFSKPETYGFTLLTVYIVWVFLTAALYMPCLWFGMLKKRWKNQWWVRYV